ncbi:restriction endonuclease subunit S [Poseidonibacter lekithochrous]|uniref:restriction endonuclease subunit S n=1 Tax=Poseidonibacter TaxID=2321187 RepID=UPI001C0807EE|nr:MULTISPECIES: restriction endonuclease subunit S [Poseidonibacter]MBU3015051.1 restriction endonuclease subunit S [Poseidonibacter lekithochrous]MDO6828348.1 restriction endonuclease subunit S [Poseidonibacter sp. 1_MG-2023]
MSDKLKMPTLRFKEFSGDWEEKELKETSKINPKTKELPNKFIYIDLESVEKGLLVKSNEIMKDEAPSRAQRVLSVNDILFQTVRPYQKNNYFFKLDGDYVASTGYAQISANESSEFLYQKLHTDDFVNKVLLRCTGTSYPAINSTDLSKIKIYIPQKQEQEKIASFLSSIDKKIEQLSKKDELLHSYKKGAMQKIFSQEIRFSPKGTSSQAQGEKDGSDYPDWEEKSLSDVSEIVGGGTPDTTKDEYWNGDIQWFTPTEIKSDNVSTSKRTISLLGLKKSSAKILPKGTILLTTRATIGEVSIALKECTTNQGFQSLVVNDSNNSIFIFNWIKRNKYKFISRANGSTFPEISKKEIEKIKIKLPCLKEQTKIANFLFSIDTKISQNRKALEETKKFKKALLQQMFV